MHGLSLLQMQSSVCLSKLIYIRTGQKGIVLLFLSMSYDIKDATDYGRLVREELTEAFEWILK